MSNDQDTAENESLPEAEAAEPAEPIQTDSAPPDPAPEEIVNAPAQEPRAGRLLPVAALIVGAAAAAGAGGVAMVGQREISSLKTALAAAQSSARDARDVARDAQNAATVVAGSVSTLDSRIGAADQAAAAQRTEINGLTTHQQALEDSVSQLTHLIQGGRNVWQLGEVEHLLLVANDRLQLQADVDGARRALTLADQRLAEMAEPRLFDVRNAIAREITALDAVPATDIHALALKLGSLVERVDTLPLKAAARPETAATPAGPVADETTLQRAQRTLLQALTALVSVRRDVPRQEPLLPPEQGFFLRQNLRLQLESARLAVLRQDSANLRVSLRHAESWLSTYFDSGDAAVGSMLRTVQDLQSRELSPTLPRISGSLTALRDALVAE